MIALLVIVGIALGSPGVLLFHIVHFIGFLKSPNAVLLVQYLANPERHGILCHLLLLPRSLITATPWTAVIDHF